MNRHQRRAARATSAFSDSAMEWPQIDVDSLSNHRGEVVHMVCRHAGGNPKVGDGGGNEDETDDQAAKRIVSYHPNFKRSA